MSRIIDADALKDNIFGYAPPEMTWDRSDIEHKIDEMLTIDAIPVEWMKEQRDKLSEAWDEEWHEINGLIEQWQEEQEAQECSGI